jgi:hypothetical protein
LELRLNSSSLFGTMLEFGDTIKELVLGSSVLPFSQLWIV